jgi:acyl-CoA oxidase
MAIAVVMTHLLGRWIGNAAEDGRAATVFARLKIPSPDGSGTVVDHGVHAIVVPLRDAAGRTLPGIEIKDCGYKVGMKYLAVLSGIFR